MRWTTGNLDLIAELTLNHVRLAVIPIIVSFLLAIPLGWLANRNKVMRAIVITGGSLLYTIPSLPLFVILPLIIPTRVLDETNLVVALSIYGVAIMARSASDALSSVAGPTVDAADAIGFSPLSRFLRVELPLAGPVLLAGIRVVSVSTIALVSVGVIIGSANLGYLCQNGKQRGILEEVVVGIVITGGSLLYTIPSLPLFVILPLIIGTRVLDETNLIVALSIYGVAVMARSAADALSSVAGPTVDAADAIGFSPMSRFLRVELPLAGPVLLAGIRVVSVSTIALVSVGVIIGSANLGYLFQNGKQRGILEEVVVGIVISLLLALIFDLALVTIGRLAMPWNAGSDAGRRLWLRVPATPAPTPAPAGARSSA